MTIMKGTVLNLMRAFRAKSALIIWIVFFFFSLIIVPSRSIPLKNPDSWHADAIHMTGSHSITFGASNLTVAVLDNGVNFSHPALIDAAWQNAGEIPSNGIDDDRNGYIDDLSGWDYVNNDSTPLPVADGKDNNNNGQIDELLWHGTFIAGLVAGNDSKEEYLGIAPVSKIMALRILDSDASFNETMFPSVLAAINYAIENGANVISFSVSLSGQPPQPFYDAVKRAKDVGIAFVSPSGNENGEISYPGKIEDVLCIGATTRYNRKAEFSNYGPQLDLVAPGQDITSCMQDNGYGTRSGTSYAVALVAGTIALMKSLNSSLSADEINQILKETAKDLGSSGKDDEYGYGLLDAENAVRKVAGLSLRSSSTRESGDNAIFYLLGGLAMPAWIAINVRKKIRTRTNESKSIQQIRSIP
ncbi:MAG: S8 family serine peptidase [Candidatus Hodarchaeota archaeon]